MKPDVSVLSASAIYSDTCIGDRCMMMAMRVEDGVAGKRELVGE